MLSLPPGVIYLVQQSPSILAPPLLTYGLVHFLEWQVSTWVLVLALLLSLPLALTVVVMWDEVYVRIEAARRGAALPPKISDPYPGGLKGLINSLKPSKTRYPGDLFDVMTAISKGYTFNIRVLFSNRVCPCPQI